MYIVFSLTWAFTQSLQNTWSVLLGTWRGLGMKSEDVAPSLFHVSFAQVCLIFLSCKMGTIPLHSFIMWLK